MEPNQKQNNLHSLVFTVLILVLSLIARSERDSFFNKPLQPTSQTATLVANIQPIETNPTAINFNGIINAGSGLKQKSGVLPPKLASQVAFAEDLNTGTALFSFNENSRWPIASVTKLMTGVVALEKVGSDKKIPINANALAVEGSAGNLSLGEVYTISDLIKIMLTVSSNRAAEAISDFYGDQEFVAEMQKKANELGMSQTTYLDSSGLSFLNQSTAVDLEKLAKYVFTDHPELLEITRQKSNQVIELKSGQSRSLENINAFAGQPDFLGGKTGFIDASSGNLLSLFTYQNHRILIIVLGTEDRFGQTQILYNWIKQSFEF